MLAIKIPSWFGQITFTFYPTMFGLFPMKIELFLICSTIFPYNLFDLSTCQWNPPLKMNSTYTTFIFRFISIYMCISIMWIFFFKFYIWKSYRTNVKKIFHGPS
jgi:hypothetical protein